MRMSYPTPKALATYGIELLEELTKTPTPSPSACVLQPCSVLELNTKPHAQAATVPLSTTEGVTPLSTYA